MKVLRSGPRSDQMSPRATSAFELGAAPIVVGNDQALEGLGGLALEVEREERRRADVAAVVPHVRRDDQPLAFAALPSVTAPETRCGSLRALGSGSGNGGSCAAGSRFNAGSVGSASGRRRCAVPLRLRRRLRRARCLAFARLTRAGLFALGFGCAEGFRVRPRDPAPTRGSRARATTGSPGPLPGISRSISQPALYNLTGESATSVEATKPLALAQGCPRYGVLDFGPERHVEAGPGSKQRVVLGIALGRQPHGPTSLRAPKLVESSDGLDLAVCRISRSVNGARIDAKPVDR